jgi:hypothetical protein
MDREQAIRILEEEIRTIAKALSALPLEKAHRDLRIELTRRREEQEAQLNRLRDELSETSKDEGDD